MNKWTAGKIHLFLPKFKFEYEAELSKVLFKMGIVDAFNDAADFSFMTGTKELYIDQVIHKAIIEVDEVGTEAAAVTVVKLRSKSKSMPKKEIIPIIRCDHPFSFYIFDDIKKVILFSGYFAGK